MNNATNTVYTIDFGTSALSLALQLQRAEQTIGLLKKYMPPNQLLHAELEIDELQGGCLTLPRITAPTSQASHDVLNERRRQVELEGWTADHDDAHEGGELAEAAICYADPAAHCQLGIPHQWPWMAEWWKPRDRRHNLVRAGALIIAEIERIDRLESEQAGHDTSPSRLKRAWQRFLDWARRDPYANETADEWADRQW